MHIRIPKRPKTHMIAFVKEEFIKIIWNIVKLDWIERNLLELSHSCASGCLSMLPMNVSIYIVLVNSSRAELMAYGTRLTDRGGILMNLNSNKNLWKFTTQNKYNFRFFAEYFFRKLSHSMLDMYHVRCLLLHIYIYVKWDK